MIRVVVLGGGNVASHFCSIFDSCLNIDLVQNYNRKGEQLLPYLDTTNEIADIIKADLYIVAFSDQSLVLVSDLLANLEGLVVHTSGSTPMSVLSGLSNYGVFYPLQSFSKEVSVNFKEVPFLLEANTKENLEVLDQVAHEISNKVYHLSSEQRNALHVAAVFANNFTNFMLTEAYQVCQEFEINTDILQPLIANTFSKIQNTSPHKAQTGPALRNDTATINRHLETLNSQEQKDLYSYLTKAIQMYYGRKKF